MRALADKRVRQQEGLFVAEGAKLVEEIEASGFRVREVYYGERVSHLKTPTGVLALVELPRWEWRPEEWARGAGGKGGRLVLALDEVQNPGNVGTIIRLADWFGVEDILCSEGTADCFAPKVVQATMGALTRVRVHYGKLEEMIPEGAEVYGTFLEGEDIYGAELGARGDQGGVIVLGSEGRGISEGVERLVTRRLTIPPWPANRPTSESLNVAVAAAIVCGEFRRRNYN